MQQAYIADSRVVELIEPRDGFALTDLYTTEYLAACVEVPAGLVGEVEPGWSWDGEAFAPPTPPPSPTLTEADYQRAIEAHVDAVARARRYSGAAACASYVNSTEPAWRAEAEAFIAWRDEVYRQAFATLAAVEAGEETPPSIEDFIGGLPPMEWPGG